jgi:hypothetical protein
LHFDVVGVSGANEYSVKPLLLVSTVAPPICAVFTVLAAAATGLPLLLLAGDAGLPLLLLAGDEGAEAEEAPDELHAASPAVAAAAAGSARRVIFRVVMTSCPLCRVCLCLRAPEWVIARLLV